MAVHTAVIDDLHACYRDEEAARAEGQAGGAEQELSLEQQFAKA